MKKIVLLILVGGLIAGADQIVVGPIDVIVTDIVTIINQALVREAYEGENVTLFVEATGPGLTYQWQKDGSPLVDGDNISGADAPVLSITNAALADSGVYSCVVSGSCGEPQTTQDVNVTIYTPLSGEILPPGPLTVCPDDFIQLTAVVNGGKPPYSYQWQKDGVDIIDATSSQLNIASASDADAGAYSCVVEDSPLVNLDSGV